MFEIFLAHNGLCDNFAAQAAEILNIFLITHLEGNGMCMANGKNGKGARGVRLAGWAVLVFCVWSFQLGTALGAQPDPALPKLTLYTAIGATTPQLPLWKMIRSGWPKGYELSVNYWKTLDDLRGIILAGKGDIWLGHLEGFAQAARRGAPVTLVAVTGWKKFYLVGIDRQATYSSPFTLEEAAAELKQRGLPLPIAPQESPAAGILKSMAARGGPAFTLAPMPIQQLVLEMQREKHPYALLPEPILSALLANKNNLRILAGLEEEYARRFGGEKRLPWVGLAVHKRLASENPAFVSFLVQALQQAAADLAGKADEAVDALPDQVLAAFGRAVLLESLKRDIILALPAREARKEIEDFLRIVLPELQAPGAMDALMRSGFLFMGEQ
jgi:NitT/TauT family transport system substrate-binding protein